MTVWDELEAVLVSLRDQQPSPLIQSPTPEVDEGRQPPFTIRLAPWAAATAAELHEQFGDDVDLTVGALPYPPGRPLARPRAARPPADPLDPNEVTADLDGPAVVRSGRTLHHGLLLRNLTAAELQIATNGQVTATVVDPRTGEVVGGFAGFQVLPLKIFHVAPGQTERIPLLIGTASSTPSLGYTIPPGEWGLQATLTLGPHPADAPAAAPPSSPSPSPPDPLPPRPPLPEHSSGRTSGARVPPAPSIGAGATQPPKRPHQLRP
jgi:hypothetical protein